MLFAPSDGGVEPFPHADKVVHATLFALLAGTGRWRFGAAPVVLAAVCAYAPASEVVQGVLLPERGGNVRDVAADLVGAGLGWLLAGRLLRSRRRGTGAGPRGQPSSPVR